VTETPCGEKNRERAEEVDEVMGDVDWRERGVPALPCLSFLPLYLLRVAQPDLLDGDDLAGLWGVVWRVE
jgi:hypothetical protein